MFYRIHKNDFNELHGSRTSSENISMVTIKPEHLYYKRLRKCFQNQSKDPNSRNKPQDIKSSISTQNLLSSQISFNGADKCGYVTTGVSLTRNQTYEKLKYEYKTESPTEKHKSKIFTNYLARVCKLKSHLQENYETMRSQQLRRQMIAHFTPLEISSQNQAKLEWKPKTKRVDCIDSNIPLLTKKQIITDVVKTYLKNGKNGVNIAPVNYSMDEMLKYVEIYTDPVGKYIVKPRKNVRKNTPSRLKNDANQSEFDIVNDPQKTPEKFNTIPNETPEKPQMKRPNTGCVFKKINKTIIKNTISRKMFKDKRLSEKVQGKLQEKVLEKAHSQAKFVELVDKEDNLWHIDKFKYPETIKLLYECMELNQTLFGSAKSDARIKIAQKNSDKYLTHPINMAIIILNTFFNLLYKNKENSKPICSVLIKISNLFNLNLTRVCPNLPLLIARDHMQTIKEKLYKILNHVIMYHSIGTHYKKAYKGYIGQGNNNLLIKSTLKQRNWWNIVKKSEISECNFIWTQWRKPDYYELFKSSNQIYNHLQGNHSRPAIFASDKKRQDFRVSENVRSREIII